MLFFRRRLLIPAIIGGLIAILILIGLSEYHQEGPNYDRIEDGLYLGGYVSDPPGRTKAVLNLCEQDDPYSCQFHVKNEIRDAAPAPSLDWLREQVYWIDLHRSAGRKVFVHCLNGVSRSGMVVTAYLMYEHGWTLNEALAFVQSKRSGVRPNPAFRPLLESWEQELDRTRRVFNLPARLA